MTSKERVLRTIRRETADRVPVNYSANAGIDRRLKEHFGLKPDDGPGLKRALGVDFWGMSAPYVGPRLHQDIPERGVKVDNWGMHRRWVEHESGGYWDYCDWPLRSATVEEIDRWPMPSPDHFDYSVIPAKCDAAKEYCIIAGGPGVGDIVNSNGMLRTMEQVLVDLVTDDPAGLRLADRRLGIWLEIMSRTLEAAGGRIDMLWLGEDLGSQRGPMMSLGLFRRHIRPRLQKFVDLAAHWRIPAMIHCCGSSSWAFPDFIEMGIAVVDTLQPEAKDMSPAYLKKSFGGKLAFHGCISTAGPVAYGSVKDVVADCRATLETLMPGGGYCFAPTHSLQDNSPTENVVAMYESARKYGTY
jgi:uroporphyrinogen decarboxylase